MVYILSYKGYAICKLHKTMNRLISEYSNFKWAVFFIDENWAIPIISFIFYFQVFYL